MVIHYEEALYQVYAPLPFTFYFSSAVKPTLLNIFLWDDSHLFSFFPSAFPSPFCAFFFPHLLVIEKTLHYLRSSAKWTNILSNLSYQVVSK